MDLLPMLLFLENKKKPLNCIIQIDNNKFYYPLL